MRLLPLILFVGLTFAGPLQPTAQEVDPGDLTEADLEQMLATAQNRLDRLGAIRTQFGDPGTTILRLGDRVIAVDAESLDQGLADAANMIEFFRRESPTANAALTERFAEIVRERAEANAAGLLSAMGDISNDSTDLGIWAIGELAHSASRAAAKSGVVLTEDDILTMLRNRVRQIEINDPLDLDGLITEWQEAYDAIDAALAGIASTPRIAPENCHSDIELAQDRVLRQDFDLFIADFNGTGRYLRGENGVYCEAGGHHFYVDGGSVWQRWEWHGDWVLNSDLVITEPDGRNAENQRVLVGYSRRPGEERLRSRYTITYPY